MIELSTKLSGILHRFTGARGVAGLAVVKNEAGHTEAIWVPSSIPCEPTFLAYSVTKSMIAVLFLQFEEDGRLDLDDGLERWFPHVPKSRQISLRQLLNHTAGVPDYGLVPEYHEAVRISPSTPWSYEKFAAATFDNGLLFEPGNGWAYSNPGYMLLKRVAEEVAGTSFAKLLSKRIAEPLDLRSMVVPQCVEDLSSLAPAPSRALSFDRTVLDAREYYHPGWVSHGVVASTASDIARFFDALFHHRLISKESLDEMTALIPVPVIPSPTDRVGKPSYGLGIMGDPESPWGPVWGHNGGGPGYTASVFYAPSLGGVSVCAMAAIEETFEAERLVFEVLDLFAKDE